MRAQKASLIIAFIVMSASAFAQKVDKKKVLPAQPADQVSDQKVDISDLENKYWAPKDTDFSVVQNRTYTKEKKFFFSLQYGVPTNDAYNTGALYGFTGNYFFTERQGVQLQYVQADYSASTAVSDLRNFSTGVFPDHGKMHDYWSAGYDFVPFYSKMSFLGKRILYFDMAITPTIGYTKYDQILKGANASETALTYGIDITQYYFLERWFALRFDWKNEWYTQQVEKYENTGSPVIPEASSAGSKNIHDSLLMFGVSFFW